MPGARFRTEPGPAGPLELASVRDHNGTLLLGFAGVPDRTAAEGLRGVLLLADMDEAADDDDAWYEKDLVGLSVVTARRRAGG